MSFLRASLLMVGATLAGPSAANPCEQPAPDEAKVRKVSIHEVVALNRGSDAVTVDANSAKTRAKYGVLPGAILLTSYSRFDPDRELPTDRATKLVFYCANTRCKASERAALRAVEAGYTDVSVMPAGIMGWRKARRGTEFPRT